ncbi:hypothetical protein GCM10010919_17250 [Alishewanella longhuensis]|uniref:Uncharacterized protein n=1 Tax=Alishewanella longhuensis TaxID=1091037 RepID=A0ABQ3KXY8_9ALTE|nr:hypothetical protein [Alishewanella longhuensis]GHG68085.1 hypothetical protein GCM10010919_17250 [Alishewanella longhuensis]
MKNKKALLFLLALLAVIKFVIQPLLQHQQLLRQDLQMVMSQLERAERTLKLAPLQQELLTPLEQQLKEQQGLFPRANNGPLFRLSIQRIISTNFSANKLEVSNFDWLLTTDDGPFEVHQLRFNSTGHPAQLFKAFNEFVVANESIEVVEFTFAQRAQANRILSEVATLTLMLNVTAIKGGQ